MGSIYLHKWGKCELGLLPFPFYSKGGKKEKRGRHVTSMSSREEKKKDPTIFPFPCPPQLGKKKERRALVCNVEKKKKGNFNSIYTFINFGSCAEGKEKEVK